MLTTQGVEALGCRRGGAKASAALRLVYKVSPSALQTFRREPGALSKGFQRTNI